MDGAADTPDRVKVMAVYCTAMDSNDIDMNEEVTCFEGFMPLDDTLSADVCWVLEHVFEVAPEDRKRAGKVCAALCETLASAEWAAHAGDTPLPVLLQIHGDEGRQAGRIALRGRLPPALVAVVDVLDGRLGTKAGRKAMFDVARAMCAAPSCGALSTRTLTTRDQCTVVAQVNACHLQL
jgi:hypothetical protein